MNSNAWRIELLGGLRVRRGDQMITRFKSQKTAGLLAYLAYHLDHAHPREVLTDIFWGESDLDAGRASLSTSLSSLRHQLEPPGTPAGMVLRADRFSVALNPAHVVTDVREFDAAVRAARKADHQAARLASLEAAAELYQARLLPGFYEDWIDPEQSRLAQAYHDVATSLITFYEQQGNTSDALRIAQSEVCADPLREEAYLALMRLLASTGQDAAALRQYRHLERVLADELGEEPSAPARVLARDIERQSGLAAPTAPPPSASQGPRSIDRRPSAPLAGRPVTMTYLVADIDRTIGMHYTWHSIQSALIMYRRIIRSQFEASRGEIYDEADTSFVVAFGTATAAVQCAIACQQSLNEHVWPAGAGRILPRIAIHTGDVESSTELMHGDTIRHANRILRLVHRGQILVSSSTAELVRAGLDEAASLADIGAYRLSDVRAAERLFQLQAAGFADTDYEHANDRAALMYQLPARVTRFFGREKEIEILGERIRCGDGRLITVTGPAGAGKTRITLETTDRLVDWFRGAVWYVELADITEAEFIPDTILHVLGEQARPGISPVERAAEVLDRQPSLLVLDNFEHLIDHGTDIVQGILTRSARLTVVVTSRQLLRLPGEQEFALAPLPTPNGGETAAELSLFDSVRLFVDRAQFVVPYFQVTDRNAAAVAELCQRLEGIPLAIELAASRALVMTPSQMLSQLDARFRFLVSRARGTSSRHRTLHSAIGWSYQLLPPDLQRFFARLSVFRGGWTEEAAEIVCEEHLALDCIEQLRECSLIVADVVATSGQMRYRILETLREFAAECLSAEDTAATRRRHALYFVHLAREKGAGSDHTADRSPLDILETEMGNIRAALDWSETTPRQAEHGREMLTYLHSLWILRGYLNDGRTRLTRLLASTALPARSSERADFLLRLCMLCWYQGDYAAATEAAQEGLAISQAIGDSAKHAGAHQVMGNVLRAQGELDASREHFEASLQMRRVSGNDPDVAATLVSLGATCELQGDYATARAFIDEGLALWRKLDVPLRIGVTLNNVGRLDFLEADYDSARAHFRESLSIAFNLGSKPHLPEYLENLARVAMADQKPERAARLLGASAALRESLGVPVPPVELADRERDACAVQSALGNETYAILRAAGRHLTLDRTVAYALGDDE